MHKILLIENHEIVRKGIRALLEGIPEMNICGEVSNGNDSLKLISETAPDIILLEVNVHFENGLENMNNIRNQYPKIKILVLSSLDYEKNLIELMKFSADGYILKNTSKDELIFAIRKIASNGRYFCSEFTLSIFSKLNQNHNNHINGNTNVKLSDREKDVLLLIADGHTNSVIAERLFTSIRTIETRRKRLLEKTGTTNTATLIRFAVKNGMVE